MRSWAMGMSACVLLSHLLFASEEQDDAPPARIEAVSTFGDLSKQNLLKLKSGHEVRLGIESLRVKAGECVMLYAEIRGKSLGTRWLESKAKSVLGPLRIEKMREGVSVAVEREQVLAEREEEMTDHEEEGRFLFRQVVCFANPGKISVELFEPEGNSPLARAAIEVLEAERDLPLWMAFEEPVRLLERATTVHPVFPVSFSGSRPAHPCLNGTEGDLIEGQHNGEKVTCDSNQPLPTLKHVFAEPGPPLPLTELRGRYPGFARLLERLGHEKYVEREAAMAELRKEGAVMIPLWSEACRATQDAEVAERLRLLAEEAGPPLRIQATQERILIKRNSELIFENGAEVFLVRWWLNGKPLRPAEKALSQLVEERTSYVTTRELSFEMDLDLEALGAKPGDRMTVQVLYCPDGWLESHDDELRRELFEQANEPIAAVGPPEMSNKAEFTIQE